LPRLGENRLAVLEALGHHYCPLLAPGGGSEQNPFESIAAVALELVADTRTARSAFELLRGLNLLEPAGLATIDLLELDDIFRQGRVKLASKALKPLRKIATWASDREFDREAVEQLSTEAIREAWRGLNGVGPATTDAILLFGLGRPTCPVDRGSYRVLIRHGWIDPSSDYDEARSALEAVAPDDPGALAQLSLALEKLGREFCKPASPRCERCPLRPFLPETGPIEEF
jgi:endonuclease-3 related protein